MGYGEPFQGQNVKKCYQAKQKADNPIVFCDFCGTFAFWFPRMDCKFFTENHKIPLKRGKNEWVHEKEMNRFKIYLSLFLAVGLLFSCRKEEGGEGRADEFINAYAYWAAKAGKQAEEYAAAKKAEDDGSGEGGAA